METMIIVMMVLVCFNYIVKQTCRKRYLTTLSAIAAALFTGLMWPYAIEQSKSQISKWITDTTLMLNIAVVLTLEVLIQMAFCIMEAKMQDSGKAKTATILIYKMLRWFPGIMVYPVLFSILVSLIFSTPGVSFHLVAWCMALAVMTVIPSASWLIKWLMPEKEIRLEVLFLSNAILAVMGIIATVNGKTAVEGNNTIDWAALIGVIIMTLIGLAAGTIYYKMKTNKLIKKKIIS